MSKNRPLTIGFVSTYPPRECGIATFTQNLEQAIKSYNPKIKMKIIALNDKEYKYPQQVVYTIKADDNKSYIKAAKFINQSDIDVVSIQHEFNIFGGFNGNKFLYLLKDLKKPVIMTMHTVPIYATRPFPFQAKRRRSRIKLLNKIFPYVNKLVVMIHSSEEFLTRKIGFSKARIKVIPHGAPEISLKILKKYSSKKTSLGFEKDDFIISTFGLISPKKGLEYIISALPEIIKNNPQKKIKFLIAGRMHPKKPKSYLEYLNKLSKRLKVRNHIIFDTRYLKYHEIYKYLANTDIYITPYYVPEQASSGTLSYAIAAGNCIISTPYIFAREMIERKKIGELIEFKNSNSISKVISNLVKHPDLIEKYQKNSHELGKTIYWNKVAEKYLGTFRSVI